MIAVAVAMLALVISRTDTNAAHALGLIQLDTHVGPIGNCTVADPNTGLCDAANTTTGTVNDAATGYDWNDICQRNTSTGRIELKPSLPAVFVPGSASCIADFMNPDHTYFQSNKDIQDISPGGPVLANKTTWACGAQANVLAKDDILNAYAVEGISPVNQHHAFYFGIERASNTGTAYQGFWFLQTAASCTAPTSTAVPFSGGPHVAGCHTPCTPDHIGDLLVLINYTGGGKVSTVQAYEWCPSSVAGCTPGGTDPLQLLTNGASCAALSPTAFDSVCAVTNNYVLTPGSQATVAQAAPNLPGAWDNHCSASTTCPSESAEVLPLNTFFEGGIDLNALLCPATATTPTPAPGTGCTIPCFSSFLAETRSSAVFSATLKDYAGGSNNTCSAAIAVRKTDAATNLLNGACFTFTDSAGTLIATVCDGGTGDKSGTAGVADGIVCIDGLGSGTYTVHETVAPGGYSVAQGADKTITVGALTTSTTCPNATAGNTVTLVDPLGSITVKKTDVTGNPLAGATFKVTPNPFYCTSGLPGGTPSPMSNPNAGSATVTDGDTTAATGSGDVTVPDPDGLANGTVTLTGVCLGTYTITETIAPAGYSLDPVASHQRTCVVADTGVPATEQKCTVSGVVGVTFVDPLGTLTINKVDLNGGAGLAGAVFSISPNPYLCHQPPGLAPTTADLTTPASGTITLTGVCIGSYTVTETSPPPGYLIDTSLNTNPQTCVVSEANGQQCSVTFRDVRESLIIRKEAKNANTTCVPLTGAGCHDLLGGATFTITPNPVTGTGSLTITDNVAPDQFLTTAGVICLDNVLVGSYTIQEVAPFPANYAPDTSTPTVAAAAGSCASRTSGATPALTPTTVVPDVTFTNTPLSAIEVQCDSVAGPGVTRCSIVCTGQTADSATTNPGDNLGENGNPDPAFDDTHEIFTSLVPGAYNCQVVIDP
jgi:hypothetical protein